MIIKHFAAVAAAALLLGSSDYCRAANGPVADKPAAQDAAASGARAGSVADMIRAEAAKAEKPADVPPSDPLSRDFAQIQADYQQVEKDCRGGNYEQAEKDLDILVEHRRKYYADQGRRQAQPQSQSQPDPAPNGTPNVRTGPVHEWPVVKEGNQ